MPLQVSHGFLKAFFLVFFLKYDRLSQKDMSTRTRLSSARKHSLNSSGVGAVLKLALNLINITIHKHY